jgi:hypothetical protein
LRSENPPEGARILQGFIMETIEHIPPLGFTGFDKNLKDGHGWWRLSKRQTDREAGEKTRLLTEGEEEHQVAGAQEDGGRRWLEIAGGGGERESPGNREQRELAETVAEDEPLARLRAGGLFLKRDMGAPDSLQCLSGAHRTAHSSCSVNHRTAHRKIEF